MKKGLLITIIVGSALLLTGAVVFAVGVANSSKEKQVTNTHELEGTISNFKIDNAVSNVSFMIAQDGKQKVVCKESEKMYHTVSLADNTLSIGFKDEKKWYENIFNFNYVKYSVDIYIPSGEYDSLTLRSSTGNVDVTESLSFNTVDVELSTGNVTFKADVNDSLKLKASTGNISVTATETKTLNIETSTGSIYVNEVSVEKDIALKASTGHITLKEVTGDNLIVNTSTGDVTLKQTILNKNIKIETSTGDVKIDGSDAETINITTTTGDVKGSLLSDKVFYVESKTGHINVPHSTTGGLCEIKTTTGDVDIYISNN